MAAKTNITLAGGIKASGLQYVAPRSACVDSPAFSAFTALSDALAEACDAEEMRSSPATWDLALWDLDASAEESINIAMEAARFAGDAPTVLSSDHKLVFAARFIYCALGIENAPDRDNVLHLISTNRCLWGGNVGGLTARRAEALLNITIDRMVRLTDLLIQEVPRKITASL